MDFFIECSFDNHTESEVENKIFKWRHAELGRAVVQRVLEERILRPPVHYCGMIFEGRDAINAIQEKVYQWWDQSATSPAKQREREAIPDPNLQLLAWHDGHCSFPQALYQKFASDSAPYKRLKEMQSEVEALFPPRVAVTNASGRQQLVNPRASGKPDFSIEGGARPLDTSREVDLKVIPAADFKEPRPLFLFHFIQKFVFY